MGSRIFGGICGVRRMRRCDVDVRNVEHEFCLAISHEERSKEEGSRAFFGWQNVESERTNSKSLLQFSTQIDFFGADTTLWHKIM